MKSKMQNCTTFQHNSFVLSEEEMQNTYCIHIGITVKLTSDSYAII